MCEHVGECVGEEYDRVAPLWLMMELMLRVLQSRPEEITLDQFLNLYNTLHGLKEGGNVAGSLEAGILKA